MDVFLNVAESPLPCVPPENEQNNWLAVVVTPALFWSQNKKKYSVSSEGWWRGNPLCEISCNFSGWSGQNNLFWTKVDRWNSACKMLVMHTERTWGPCAEMHLRNSWLDFPGFSVSWTFRAGQYVQALMGCAKSHAQHGKFTSLQIWSCLKFHGKWCILYRIQLQSGMEYNYVCLFVLNWFEFGIISFFICSHLFPTSLANEKWNISRIWASDDERPVKRWWQKRQMISYAVCKLNVGEMKAVRPVVKLFLSHECPHRECTSTSHNQSVSHPFFCGAILEFFVHALEIEWQQTKLDLAVMLNLMSLRPFQAVLLGHLLQYILATQMLPFQTSSWLSCAILERKNKLDQNLLSWKWDFNSHQLLGDLVPGTLKKVFFSAAWSEEMQSLRLLPRLEWDYISLPSWIKLLADLFNLPLYLNCFHISLPTAWHLSCLTAVASFKLLMKPDWDVWQC